MENRREHLKTSLKKSLKKTLGTLYYHSFHRYFPPGGNRILIYHALGSKLPDDTYGTSMNPVRFREHLSFLKDHVPVVSPDQIASGQDLPEHSVTLTFDDGYKDNLLAAEACERAAIPYTIYVIASRVNQPLYLSEKDLRDLSKSRLCTVGSHGVTHEKLGLMPEPLAKAEIENSKHILQQYAGCSIQHLSYPHGSYHQGLFPLLKEAGYKTAACSSAGINPRKNPGLYHLKRSEVIASDTVSDLREKILGYYDYLAFRRKPGPAPEAWKPDLF